MEWIEKIPQIAEMSDEELLAFKDELLAANTDLGDVTTAKTLETLSKIVEAVEAVDAQVAARAQAVEEAKTKAEELRQKLAPVAEVPEEPAPVEEPEPVEEPAPVEAKEEAEPIAASAKPKRPVPGKAKAPIKAAPVVVNLREPVITAAGGNAEDGQRFGDLKAVGEAMVKKWGSIGRAQGKSERIQFPVATFHAQYPEDRTLGNNAAENDEKIQAVTSLQAIVASGGLCAPLAPLYTQPNISDASRPVRDSLPAFQASRGGITWIPTLHLPDVAGAITEWTAANDANPSSPSTKAFVTINCETASTSTIEAISTIFKFGNFGARTFPERMQTAIELGMAAHARVAELALLDAIDDASVAVTAAQNLGTTRDVLAVLDRAIAGYRYRNRTAREMPLRIIIPEWLDDNMRTDLARQAPGDSVSGSSNDRLAVADAQINSFYASRGVNVTRALDDTTTPSFNQQGVGDLNPWPTDVPIRLFHEGAHLFLDGGTLDLGVVRDSTLNSTNDFEMFSETFEGAAFVGVESLVITLGICPSGLTQSIPTTVFDPCTSGS